MGRPKNYLCFAALLEIPPAWEKDTFYAILNEDGNSVTCYITSKTGVPKIIGSVTSVLFTDLNLNSSKHSIASINGNLIQETITSLQDFELDGEELSITLNNEDGEQQTLTVDLSSLTIEPVNIIAGTNITVTGTYPNLTISSTGGGSGGGQVDEIGEGTGIEVDNTDPTAPIVSLDSATQTSLLKADSALQSGDNISELTNDAGYVTTDDQTATEVSVTPTGNLSSTNVQSALVELQGDIDGISTHAPVTVTDSSEIDFTLTGQDITASIVAGSIDETKLDVSVNASLDLADSAIQSETDPVFTASQAFNIDAGDITNLSNLSGTNSGDQTSIVGITGTKAQFDTAVTDGNIMYIGDAPTAHTHTASEITDFDTEVANNTAVAANTVKVGVTVEEANTIDSVTAGEPSGSDQVLNVVSLTQAEYDGGSPNATTFYIITDA